MRSLNNLNFFVMALLINKKGKKKKPYVGYQTGLLQHSVRGTESEDGAETSDGADCCRYI